MVFITPQESTRLIKIDINQKEKTYLKHLF